MRYRDLAPNEARICFWNDVYYIYRPDVFYVREIWTSRTLCEAVEFCRKNNWEPVL